MPTGYTATLYDGEQSFEEFAMGAARGMGALIAMRDEPLDAEIPDEFKPDTSYHDREIEEAREDLRALDGMSISEANRRAAAEHDEKDRRNAEVRSRAGALRKRYEAMLARVRTWEPPTADHQGLKDFMVQQLEESIRFDCGTEHLHEPKLPSPQEWVEQQRAKATRNLEYHLTERENVIERARSRSAWVKTLRESLEPVREEKT